MMHLADPKIILSGLHIHLKMTWSKNEVGRSSWSSPTMSRETHKHHFRRYKSKKMTKMSCTIHVIEPKNTISVSKCTYILRTKRNVILHHFRPLQRAEETHKLHFFPQKTGFCETLSLNDLVPNTGPNFPFDDKHI